MNQPPGPPLGRLHRGAPPDEGVLEFRAAEGATPQCVTTVGEHNKKSDSAGYTMSWFTPVFIHHPTLTDCPAGKGPVDEKMLWTLEPANG